MEGERGLQVVTFPCRFPSSLESTHPCSDNCIDGSKQIQVDSFHPFCVFQLVFVAKVAPLGVTTYFVSSGLGAKQSEYSSITEYNTNRNPEKPRWGLNKRGTFLNKLWCGVGGEKYKMIWSYQLTELIVRLTFRALALRQSKRRGLLHLFKDQVMIAQIKFLYFILLNFVLWKIGYVIIWRLYRGQGTKMTLGSRLFPRRKKTSE